MAVAAIPASANEASVQWSEGRLSVAPTGQPLGRVLRAIETRTGLVVKGADTLVDPMRGGLDRVPLAEGLRRMLAGQNYMLVEGDSPGSTRVFIVAGETRPRPAGQITPVEERQNGPSPAEKALSDSDPAVRIEAIEQLGGQTSARSLALLRQAMNDPNDAVRAVAREALQARPTPSSSRP